MKYFDSHCHLDFEPLSSELSDVVERATKAGVAKMINVGSSLRGSERSVEIANLYPNIWASVGLHPHDAETTIDLPGAIDKLRELAKNDKVVAIGEIGLDYFDSGQQSTISAPEKEKQKELFVTQLELAHELKLPVIIHVRDAWDDFFTVLHATKYMLHGSGVLHCFTGDAEIAQKLIDLDFYVGFTGFITFDQDKFNNLREAAKVVPLDKTLVETDAPFLAPEPYRGKTNEPGYVVEVAKKIAEIKNVSTEEIAESTFKNTERLFLDRGGEVH